MRSPLAAALLGSLALQLFVLFPQHRTLDLPRYDECHYMGWGGGLLSAGEPLPGLVLSPLYSTVYAGLVAAFGPEGAVFAMKYLAAAGASLALCAFLAVSLGSPAVALALTAFWSLGEATVRAPTWVNQFGLFSYCLALLIARWRRAPAALALASSALVRPEYALVLGAALLGWGLERARRRRAAAGTAARAPRLETRSLAALGAGGLLLAGVLAAVSSTGWQLHAWRTWFAFRQHYAVGEWLLGRYRVANPWLEYGALIEADFAGAESLGEAVRSNPRAVARHVARNARQLPGAALAMFEPARSLAWGRSVPWLALLFAPALAAGALRRSGRAWLWPERLRSQLRGLGGSAAPLFAGPLALLPALLVMPKPDYAVVALPLLLWLAGAALTAALDALHGSRLAGLRAAPGLVFALLALLVGLGPRPFETSAGRRNRELVAAGRRVWPERRTVLLGVDASCYASYLGRGRAVGIEANPAVYGGAPPPGGIGIDDLLAIHRPDAVLVNAGLTRMPGFRKQTLRLLEGPGWEPVRIGRNQVLYFRKPVQ